jgi:hypothetical protein
MKQQKEAAIALISDEKHTTAASPKAFTPRTSPKKRDNAAVRKSDTPFQGAKRLKFPSITVAGRVDRINYPKHYAKATVIKVLMSTETGAHKCMCTLCYEHCFNNDYVFV